MKGWFDILQVPKRWFDALLDKEAWFDKEIVASTPSMPANFVGYAKNSGGYSGTACYGVVPDIAVYHHPSEGTSKGMLLIGKTLYSDEACTTALSAAATWWSFDADGNAANRAMQIDGSGNIMNVIFQNGIVFGYAKEGGDCNSTSGFDAIYNAVDDTQLWYPRKAVAKSATVNGGILVAATTQALSYVNTGSVIGTATFDILINFQNTYTSMTSCSVTGKYFKVYIRD